jgi:ribosomal protein S18 acetylase RimI-like enzyme
MSVALEIVELMSDQEILSAFPLMSILRDRLRQETFLAEIRVQESEDFRLIGGYADGKLVALAGVRRAHTTARGAHAFVDDLVTLPEAQGKGYARQMLQYVAAQAAANGLPHVYLDSRATALGFYDKLGFRFLTSIPCWIHSETLANLVVKPSEL